MVHAVDPESLFLHQPHGAEEVCEGRIARVAVAEDVVRRDAPGEAPRVAHHKRAVVLDPPDIGRLGPVPVAVDQSVEHGLAHRVRRDLAHGLRSEGVGVDDEVVERLERFLDVVQLFEQRRGGVGHHAIDHVAAVDVENGQFDERTRGRGEQQAPRLRESVVTAYGPQAAQQVLVGLHRIRPCVAAHQSESSLGDIVRRHSRRCGHGVGFSSPLPVLPPLGSVDPGAFVSHPPAQAVAGVMDRFGGFGDVEDQHSLTGHVLDDDVRRDADGTIDALAQPVDIELRAEDLAGAVLDAEDQRASPRRVGEARYFVCQFRGGLRILSEAGLEL